jgi:uncharacterized protein YjiS (DUF1127 family)
MQAHRILIDHRIRHHAGLQRAQAIVAFAIAAGRFAGHWLGRLAAAQRNARIRRDLHAMSDHMLRDVGLERGRIDALFH